MPSLSNTRAIKKGIYNAERANDPFTSPLATTLPNAHNTHTNVRPMN